MLLSTPRKGKRDGGTKGDGRQADAKESKKERKKRKDSLKSSLNFKDIRSGEWRI
jgi:hypothetical protein